MLVACKQFLYFISQCRYLEFIIFQSGVYMYLLEHYFVLRSIMQMAKLPCSNNLFFLFAVVCDRRTFGYNCSSTCNCFNNTSCKTTTGDCYTGLCESGWQGSRCDQGVNYFHIDHILLTSIPVFSIRLCLNDDEYDLRFFWHISFTDLLHVILL